MIKTESTCDDYKKKNPQICKVILVFLPNEKKAV